MLGACISTCVPLARIQSANPYKMLYNFGKGRDVVVQCIYSCKRTQCEKKIKLIIIVSGHVKFRKGERTRARRTNVALSTVL